MKITKIIVDKLPESCGKCEFVYDRCYCKPKGLFSGQEWVDITSDNRDKDCPLELNKELELNNENIQHRR